MVLRNSRLTKNTDQLFDQFNASIGYDYQLLYADTVGSLAHVSMLAHCDILSQREASKIIKGLKAVCKNFESGKIQADIALEDIHMNIEAQLINEVGEVGKKVHTSRSRNDQVALAVRIYLRKKTVETLFNIQTLITTLCELAVQEKATILPGYTHLQRAQPVLLSHHLLAYAAMLSRDFARFADTFKRLNVSPLGAGAIAGASYPIDLKYLANLLNFASYTNNSIDTVSSRDHLLEYLSCAANSYTHLSRMAEELIIWASSEFNYVHLPDEYCTTSSMMPQKKNPDLLELIRGKSGRVNANLFSLLTTTKGISLSYFKDLQEDKEPLFDTVYTLNTALVLLNAMLKKTKFNREQMLVNTQTGYLDATDAADYLTKKGMAFRTAHEIIGQLVGHAEKQNLTLAEVPLEQLQKFTKLFTADFYQYIKLDQIIKRKNWQAGSSPRSVQRQLASFKTQNKKNLKLVDGFAAIADVSIQDF